jgi:hypothetical protein
MKLIDAAELLKNEAPAKAFSPEMLVVGKGHILAAVKGADCENAALRGALARLCRAVSRRMMPDEPTPEDRMELREAFDAASEFLHNADVLAPAGEKTPTKPQDD